MSSIICVRNVNTPWLVCLLPSISGSKVRSGADTVDKHGYSAEFTFRRASARYPLRDFVLSRETAAEDSTEDEKKDDEEQKDEEDICPENRKPYRYIVN